VDRHNCARVSSHGSVQCVSVRALDEDRRDRDAHIRTTHDDSAGTVVVVDDRANSASVLRVDDLGGEEADATANQGDLAGHGGSVGEASGGGLAVAGLVTDAAVERVGDDNLRAGGECGVVHAAVAVEDSVSSGVEATGPVDHHVLGVAEVLRRRCRRLRKEGANRWDVVSRVRLWDDVPRDLDTEGSVLRLVSDGLLGPGQGAGRVVHCAIREDNAAT